MKKYNNFLDFIVKANVANSFDTKMVNKSQIREIVVAGSWGLSILGVQPWEYVVVTNESVINEIAKVMKSKVKSLPVGFSSILKISTKIIQGCKCVIFVYNNCKVSNKVTKYVPRKDLLVRTNLAEIQSISSSIQNMFLMAKHLGLGAIWIDAPVFCKNEINEILEQKNEMVAALLVGHSKDLRRRSKRKVNVKIID